VSRSSGGAGSDRVDSKLLAQLTQKLGLPRGELRRLLKNNSRIVDP